MKEKLNFSTVLANNTTYDGDQLESYILKAFTKNKTVASVPAENVIDNIFEKTRVGKLDGSDLVQVGSNCDFSDSGTVNISEAVLEPKPFFINVKLCYEDLLPIYNTLNNGSMNEQELSGEFATKLTEMMISKMNQSWEDVVWNGVYDATGTTVLSQFNGIDTFITTNVVTGATITAANIIASLSSMVAEVPNDVLEKENLTIYMNQRNLQLYYDALFTLGVITPLNDTRPTYKGIPIVTISKIKNDRMYVIETGNIFFGVGSLTDFENMQIIDMKKLGQGNHVRLVLQGRGDVKLGWEEEAVKFEA